MDVWRLVARGGHHILLFPARSCGGIIGDSAARLQSALVLPMPGLALWQVCSS